MRLAALSGRAVVLAGDGAVDIRTASGGRFGPDPMDVLADWDEFASWVAVSSLPVPEAFDAASLGAPVPRPRRLAPP